MRCDIHPTRRLNSSRQRPLNQNAGLIFSPPLSGKVCWKTYKTIGIVLMFAFGVILSCLCPSIVLAHGGIGLEIWLL